jgi:glycosyltransferase involved in cell wall biosynthesis
MERSKVHEYLAKFSGFGLAPYTSVSRWTAYCSPLKVIEYLAYGIPVIMSDIPEVSDEIVRNSLGIVYNQVDKSSIGREIQKFSFVNFSDKAYQFSKKYYFKEIFEVLPL